MAFSFALQLYTVREVLKADLEGGLAAVAKAGYEYVEGSWLEEAKARDRRAIFDRVGLKQMGIHAGIDNLVNKFDQTVATLRIQGGAYATPSLRLETAAAYREAARKLNDVAPRYAQQGITLCYHNHNWEFKPLPDGPRAIDILMAEAPHLCFEVDVAWVKIGGDDPAALIRKLGRRAPILHIKDARPAEKPTFTEVGTGMVDLPGVIAAARAVGSKYLIVEQDGQWIDGDAVKSARISLENLRKAAG